MRKFKVTCLVLLCAIIMTMCSACKSEEKKPESDDLANIKPMTENTMPITEEEITLNVWMENMSQGYMKSYNDMKAFEELRKRTGIKLNFIHPTGKTENQLELLLAANDYPDIVFSQKSKTSSIQAEIGAAVRLNEYIDAYAPNINKVFNEHADYKKQFSLVDDDVIKIQKITDDQRFLCYDGYFIRMDWLDKVGLGIPQTIDEWYNVLKAFKNTDLNGNGKHDEVPFSTYFFTFEETFSTAFDIPKYEYFKVPGENKITHAVLAPRFKEYLTTMHKWYSEGLINPNFLNTNTGELDAILENDQLGAVYCDNNNLMPRYMQTKPEMRLVAVPYPMNEKGIRYYPNNNIKMMVRNEGAIITKNCKYVKEAVRFFDYLFSEEGQTLMNWGIEGESYTVDKDGKKKYTDLILNNPDKKTPPEAICKYMTNTGFVGVQQYEAGLALEENLPPDIKKVKNDSVNMAMATEKTLKPLPPKFTTEEVNQISQKESEIDSYINDMIAKFILGVEPLEKFDAFVQTTKEMGIDEVISVYQTAYERQGFE
ncbi:MAG: extracellular solute-binding protein [Oscillospiraceae bacterium]